MKRYFKSTRKQRLVAGVLGLILAPLGTYCLFQGWHLAANISAAVMVCALVYMGVGVAIDEDETARKLWPQLFAAEDAAKAIAKAKKKR